MITLDPNSTREYVLRDDRSLPPEEQSVFLLRPLTLAQQTAIKDAMASVNASQDIKINAGTQELHALRFGLAGWRNVRDSKGNQEEAKGTTSKRNGVDFFTLDDTTIEKIPPKYRAELAEEITNGSGLSGDEAKN